MVLGLLILVPFTRQLQQRPTSFYGIAENQDLDLSLEYPVQVEAIMIKEGQNIAKGQLLAVLHRSDIAFQQAKLLQNQSELLAEKNELLTSRNNDLRQIDQEERDALFEIDNQIATLQAAQTRNSTLLESLSSLEGATPPTVSNPEVSALQAERTNIAGTFNTQRQNIRQEVAAKLQSLDTRLQQITIEEGEIQRQTEALELRAPAAGIAGSVNFVPGEQITTGETILNIYQVHPNQVITYIPEGQLTDLKMGDSLLVFSLQNPDYSITGKVIGLGNKIRELPVRMRRDPAVQAWGREVLLEIAGVNDLMQGERVLVEQILD